MPVLGSVLEVLFSSSKIKEAARDPTLRVAWLEELIKEPGPASVSRCVGLRR